MVKQVLNEAVSKTSNWMKVKVKRLKRFVQGKSGIPQEVLETTISRIDQTLERHNERLISTMSEIDSASAKAMAELHIHEDAGYQLKLENVKLRSAIRSHETSQTFKLLETMIQEISDMAHGEDLIKAITEVTLEDVEARQKKVEAEILKLKLKLPQNLENGGNNALTQNPKRARTSQ